MVVRYIDNKIVKSQATLLTFIFLIPGATSFTTFSQVYSSMYAALFGITQDSSVNPCIVTKLATLIVTYSAFVDTNNTLWTWHDECNMSLWWCCVPVAFFVYGHKKLRANFLARQLQSCLSFSTRNKIDYEIFVSI